MSTSVPITTSAVTVTDNGSTVAVSVASSAVSVDVGTTGPQGATGPGVAAGGSTGQVLVKASGTNYDTAWTSSPTFGTATMTLGTATTLQAGTATLTAASIGSVSNAEIQYLDGLTEPLTTSLAGKSPLAVVARKPRANEWLSPIYGAYSTTNSWTNAAPYAVPIYLHAGTLDRIGVEVVTTAGSTGSLIRLGIYNDGGGIPTTLLLDAGTVDTTTTGSKEITISQAVSSTVYWLVAVPQGGAATQPTLRIVTGGYQPINSTSAASANAQALTGTAASGALNASFGTPSTTIPTPRIFVRYSAVT